MTYSLINQIRQQFGNKIKRLNNVTDHQPRYRKIEVASNVNECQRVLTTLKEHCNEYNVLGFDCEWVNTGKTRRPVALLQLASHCGLCALIRFSHLTSMPAELRNILQNSDIVKVGVAPIEDARFLAEDYGVYVASTLDLRFMAVKSGCQSGGLGKMSQNYLDVKLDKSLNVICSDWEAPRLSPKQLDYAAKDAHVAIELFQHFAGKIEPKPCSENSKTYVKRIIDEYCRSNFDQMFQESANTTKTSTNSNATDAKT